MDAVVGEGGAGVVYRGQNLLLGEPVAIKFVRPGENAVPLQEQSFFKEAKLLFSLAHPNIVRMYDLGEHTTPKGQVTYLVLEYIDGISLDGEIRRRAAANTPFLAADVQRIFSAVLEAASFAHTKKVTHRDLKPSNVMLSRDGLVKMLDFGTARLSDQATRLTAHFTPRYAAPEQWDPARGTRGPWTDVYALGLILFEMGTLRTAAQGDDLPTIIKSVLAPERPTFRGVRPDLLFLEPILSRALALETSARFPNAEAMLAGLRTAYEGTGRASPLSLAQTAPLTPDLKSTLAINGPNSPTSGTPTPQGTPKTASFPQRPSIPAGAGLTLPLNGSPLAQQDASFAGRPSTMLRPGVPPGAPSTLFVPELQQQAQGAHRRSSPSMDAVVLPKRSALWLWALLPIALLTIAGVLFMVLRGH